MKRKITKKNCLGCRNDFYNGKNDLGVGECWSFKNAELISRKKVSIHQFPPWNQKPILALNCYHATGFVFIPPERKN